MDDVKDIVKGFKKKVYNPFSWFSGKFKGRGRVVGSSSSGPSNSNLARPTQIVNSSQNPPVSNPKPKSQIPQDNSDTNQKLKSEPIPQKQNALNSDHKKADGFDPFRSLVTSGKRSQNGYSLNVVEESQANVSNAGGRNELMGCVGVFLSGNPSEGSVEVVLKLLRNIIKEPNNAKFRRIRMSNPKIREAVGVVAGGVELLEFVGFRLQEEGGEMWAVMEEPLEKQISLIKESLLLLEPQKKKDVPCFSKKVEELTSVASTEVEVPVQLKKIDRQIRVFFSVPERIARQINLPESFLDLSAEEVRREVEMRKKKIVESQLLIPKSYKEKQAKAMRKRYKNAVIRIQFPDEVVLQGVFFPWERTSVLYEFVSSALKEPSFEFKLLHPVMIKQRVIPQFPVAGDRTPTLEEEDLVPTALVRFRPIETDSVFTGLCDEFLEISEPLQAAGRLTLLSDIVIGILNSSLGSLTHLCKCICCLIAITWMVLLMHKLLMFYNF